MTYITESKWYKNYRLQTMVKELNNNINKYKKTLKMEDKLNRLKNLIGLIMPIVSYSYEIQKQLKEEWIEIEKYEAQDWEIHLLMNTTRMQISLARQFSSLLGKQQKLVEEILRENNGQTEMELKTESEQ